MPTQAAEPRLLVEVLSPSKARFDKFQKIEEYKQHEAVRVVLLVDTESANLIVWRRLHEGYSSSVIEGVEAVIALPEIGFELRMSDVYEDMSFQPTPGLERPARDSGG